MRGARLRAAVFPIFRFLRMAVGRRDRRPVLEERRLRMRVHLGDLDENLHMNNGRYLTLMGLGRTALVLDFGLAREARRRRWTPLVAAVNVRYRRALGLWERFDLTTRIVGWDERWVYFEQRFVRGGEVMATAWVRTMLAGPGGIVATRDLLPLVGHEGPSPPLPEGFAEWLRSQDAPALTASTA